MTNTWGRSVGMLVLLGLVACGESAQRGAPTETLDAAPTVAVAPVNIAHRGASAYAPEHTLAAYRLAIEMGADYVEQDLQLTSDGVLICMHDTTLNRTTDVEEVFPDRSREVEIRGEPRAVWRVSDFTLDEIKTLDAGVWFSDEFAGTRVPTFQEAIDLVQGQAGMYPETKAPGEYEALGFTMEEELVRVFRRQWARHTRGAGGDPALRAVVQPRESEAPSTP